MTKKTKSKNKKGGYIYTPHNKTTGWHYASQPAPVVNSLSYGIDKREFQQLGGGKVHIKGVGTRKVRYFKNGKRYVLVNKKKMRI